MGEESNDVDFENAFNKVKKRCLYLPVNQLLCELWMLLLFELMCSTKAGLLKAKSTLATSY